MIFVSVKKIITNKGRFVSFFSSKKLTTNVTPKMANLTVHPKTFALASYFF